MTNEDLAKKLEGVIKVTPSFDFLLLSGDKILKVVVSLLYLMLMMH